MTLRRSGVREITIEAMIEAIVGLFVAIVAMVVAYVTPLHVITSDLSQKALLVVAAAGGALGNPSTERHGRAAPANWFFIDLGPRFCGGESGGDSCPPNVVRTDREKLATLLSSVRSKSPRVVVLDVLTAPEPLAVKGDGALARVLEAPGAPVLLSWAPGSSEIRPSLGPQSLLVARGAGVGADPGPGAKYFPALRRMSGPTARWLTPAYDVFWPDQAVTRSMPGIAYAAALVAAAPAEAPWRDLDRFATPARPLPPSTHEVCELKTAPACLEAYHRTERVFSFAPVSIAEVETSQPPISAHYLALANDPASLTDRLADAVVVIGDSRATAGDRTWSAVGEVSGAELILNDIRQYLLAPPTPQAGIGHTLIEEVPFLVAGFAAIFISSALVLRFWPSSPEPIGLSVLRNSARTSARLGMVFVLTAGFYTAILALGRTEFGRVPNFVAPFVGVLLETLFDLLHQATTALHDGLRRLLGRPHGSPPLAAEGEGS